MIDFLRRNIHLIHTTPLSEQRIKNNLHLADIDVLQYCKIFILSADICYVKGKNIYCTYDNRILTINRFTFTVITAHIIK